MRFFLATSIVALAVLVIAAPQPIERGKGIAIPITKRFGSVNPDGTVNLSKAKSNAASAKTKVGRGMKNFARNTGNRHPFDRRGLQKRNAVPLTDDNSVLWYGNVSVGTPAQSFRVDFDTGSSDLFLPGSRCDSTCSDHAIWDPKSSSTSINEGVTVTLKYGDNSTAIVKVFTDTVTLGGYKAINQALGAAENLSAGFQFANFSPDGLMGMAFSTISVYNASPPFQTLVSEGALSKPVFSFKLSSSDSELYIGGVNYALFIGDFTYTPVTIVGFWQVIMDGVLSNGILILGAIDCIIDTGTTLIIVPPAQASDLYNAIGGQPAPTDVGSGFYTFPCNSFPKISFIFGGRPFEIFESILNLGPVSPGSPVCVSGLIGQDTGSSLWVIGDVFLQCVYTVFDMGNLQVGFATLAPPTSGVVV